MLPVGPAVGPDTGQPRPAICLGNAHGRSCPTSDVERLAACLRQSFDLPAEEVTVNRPFAGGYLTRRYGNRPVPWIQIEINRQLYLNTNNPETPDRRRLAEMRAMFSVALAAFCESG
jgi:formiminoglutamase